MTCGVGGLVPLGRARARARACARVEPAPRRTRLAGLLPPERGAKATRPARRGGAGLQWGSAIPRQAAVRDWAAGPLPGCPSDCSLGV
jgi:hypothetical protein